LEVGYTDASVFGCPQVRALENSASVCLRGTLRVRAGLPSAGDGPPSPWPRRGSRYDLARLYRLRRRVIVDGLKAARSCGSGRCEGEDRPDHDPEYRTH
jgi:hypothetical protein